MRIGTANNYDQALEQLYQRQSDLSAKQERLSSGLRVNRASDDPGAAAQAERAMTRLSRIETDQRALEVQRAALVTAESALGEATGLLQGSRDFMIAAGNAGYSAADRSTLAQQMTNLRDQLFDLSNRTDSNGVPLFGGLGSSSAPFADIPAGVQFQGVGGQRAANTTTLPGTMNGQAIWMNIPSGNRTVEVGLGAANTGSLWTDVASIVTPAALTGDSYSLTFSVVGGVTTYDVVDTTTATTVAAAQPYNPGGAIQFDGLSIVAQGTPGNGDRVSVAPSTTTNIFRVLDDAIASIDGAPSDNRVSQAVALALAQIDTSLERVSAARGQAGDWLKRADNITDAQAQRTLTLQTDHSRAVDLDMARGISEFNLAQTGYQAALQSYAQVQRLTLFNYIN